MKKCLVIVTFLFIMNTLVPADSGNFYSLSHQNYDGYIVENKTKMLISPFYNRDISIQPGETRKIKNNDKQFLFRWSVDSSKEAYMRDENYYILLNNKSNKITINSSNNNKNGFPWSLTKVKSNEDLVLNISANYGNEVYYSYRSDSYIIKKLPSKIVIPINDMEYWVILFIKYNNKVYSVIVYIPFRFKGGEYNLRFELLLNPRTTVNMVNDDKNDLKLSGCDCLEGLFNGCYRLNNYFDYAPGVMYFPSPYVGKHNFNGIVYNQNDKDMDITEAYSKNFSYEINYYKQYFPKENPVYELLRNEIDSDKTEVTVGDYFQNDVYLDIYDTVLDKFIIKNVKHYVCEKSKYIFFFAHDKSGYIGSNYEMDFWVNESHSMTFNIGRVNDYDSKIIYTSKGIQFFEKEDYFLSGLNLKKGNPVKMVDGKMYIKPITFIQEIEGIVVNDDSKTLVLSARLSGTKSYSQITIDKTKLSLTIDGKAVKLDANILIINNEKLVPLQSFAKAMGCQTNYYNKEKTLCLTYK